MNLYKSNCGKPGFYIEFAYMLQVLGYEFFQSHKKQLNLH